MVVLLYAHFIEQNIEHSNHIYIIYIYIYYYYNSFVLFILVSYQIKFFSLLEALKGVATNKEEMKLISSKWKEISEEDREKWKNKAKQRAKADPNTMTVEERKKAIKRETKILLNHVSSQLNLVNFFWSYPFNCIYRQSHWTPFKVFELIRKLVSTFIV